MKKILVILSLILLITSTTSYASVSGPYRAGFIEGFADGWEDGRLRIEEYDGTLHTLSFDIEAVYMIDGRYAVESDFKAGMEVYARLKGRTIVHLEGYSTVNPGYIKPGGRVRGGTVQTIDRDQIVLKLPTGLTETYFTTLATVVLKKGVNVPLSTLYEGDRVRLYFDEVDSQLISRVEIEGDSVMIKDIYKGRLKLVDYFSNTVTLDDVEVMKNGKWDAVKSSMSISYSEEFPIYIGGQQVSANNLKYYTGKTVYMAIKGFFGSSKVERMVINNRYESTYSDKIREINWFTGIFELENNRNITFNDGTLVIKNGRLVDQYSINSMSDALVIVDGRGQDMMADVVYILDEDINNSNIGQNYIYAGRLDQVIEDSVMLKNFFLLNRNEWEAFDEEKEFFYDNDTCILDMEAGKQISMQEFYAGYYSVDESSSYAKDNNLKDWYAYAYTDGDRIASIMVKKSMDSLLNQRATNGVIERITNDEMVGWAIDLRNASDWSGRKDKWLQKSASTRINVEKSMLLKYGRIISPEELKTGDRLYVVRDGFEARIVIVK